MRPDADLRPDRRRVVIEAGSFSHCLRLLNSGQRGDGVPRSRPSGPENTSFQNHFGPLHSKNGATQARGRRGHGRTTLQPDEPHQTRTVPARDAIWHSGGNKLSEREHPVTSERSRGKAVGLPVEVLPEGVDAVDDPVELVAAIGVGGPEILERPELGEPRQTVLPRLGPLHLLPEEAPVALAGGDPEAFRPFLRGKAWRPIAGAPAKGE